MIQEDTLSTIYTLLADNKSRGLMPSLTTELYDILPSIAVIDPENYVSHREHLEGLTRDIEQTLTHTATSKTSIGIGGGFSTGKSRFINTLLTLDILPEAIEPCTAVATYLTHSKSDHTEALNIFDSTISIEQEQLKNLRHFIGDDSENTLHISQIIKHVIVNSQQIKWQNLNFLDTPGYSKADAKNSIVNDENLALTQLSSVDHIVWLVSAKNGMIRDDDIKFLHQIDHQNPVFIVITQADLVNQEDILPIMEGIQQHLEKNNIAVAGLMAWAAPAYEFEGKQVAGDNIKIWLDKLNVEEHDTYLSDFIDYCQKLTQLAFDKIVEVEKDSNKNNLSLDLKSDLMSAYEAKKLVELLKAEQESIIVFMDKVISLAKNDSSFDWSLAELYESNKVKGGMKAALDIYHRQVKYNPDKAIEKITKIMDKHNNIDAIQTLANIYETLFNDIENSAKYHILIIKNHSNTQQALTSWSWLFFNATKTSFVFEKLESIVLGIDDSERHYRFALVAETLKNHELCIKFMLKSAEGFFYSALSYIAVKAENDSELKLKLGNIYQRSSAIVNKEMAVNIYKELAKNNNQKALINLELMIKNDTSLLALEALAEIYEYSFGDIKQASNYHVKISKLLFQREGGSVSLNWLFKNSETYEDVYHKLYQLIYGLDKEDLNYRFGVLSENIDKSEISRSFILNSANKNYKPAIKWLDIKSKNDPELMLELAAIYDKYNNSENIEKSLKIYEELAIAKNEKALKSLDVLARMTASLKAMDILAKIYVSENNNSKATSYNLLIVKHHPKSDVAENSWNWLFNNAENNEKIFIKLKNVVDQNNSIDISYRMAELLDRVGDINNATDYYLLVIGHELNSGKKKYSWDWILNKAEKNQDVFMKLEYFIDKCNSVESIYKMAKFSEKMNYINISADYHYRVISIYPESDVAKCSWDWLFHHAKTNENAFTSLKNVVDKSNSPDTNYRMVNSLEEIGNHALATEYAAKNILSNHFDSEDWLFKRARNIKHPARRKLLDLYSEYSNVRFKQEDTYTYFIESILNKDEKAFSNLEYLAENSGDRQAMWILSLCYLHGECTAVNNEKSLYWVSIASECIEEAKYNYDVMQYNVNKENHPFTYEARLFFSSLLTTKSPLFENQGSLRYMFYLSLLTPEFISFDEKEPSYSINYMTCLMPIFLTILLIF
ncbi:dynamin family protein [Psychrobacter cibarius]|uniref:dynamin family protein n=1 Tax=Psychrobacter cibarius TaxID=282669 RepID=UPI003FD391AE